MEDALIFVSYTCSGFLIWLALFAMIMYCVAWDLFKSFIDVWVHDLDSQEAATKRSDAVKD